MKRSLLAGGLALVFVLADFGQGRGPRGGMGMGTAPGAEQYPPVAKTETEKRILATIDAAVKAGELFANVPAADGRMLRLLAESVNARNVIELGTSTGISGLWFCLALDKTGGRLTTFELDPGRAATAAAHFRKAGVDRLVTDNPCISLYLTNTHDTIVTKNVFRCQKANRCPRKIDVHIDNIGFYRFSQIVV